MQLPGSPLLSTAVELVVIPDCPLAGSCSKTKVIRSLLVRSSDALNWLVVTGFY